MTSLLEIAGGHDLRIETKRFYLRPLSEGDCGDKYLSWLNDNEVSRYTGRYGRKFIKDDMVNYVMEANSSPKQLLLGLFVKENKSHIGNILLDDYNSANGTIWISNMIGDKDYWAKGAVIEADKHLIHFAFKNLKIRKFMIGNMAPHRAATFMSTQLGFEKEALHKKHFAYDGGYVDVVYFGLFADRFYEKFPELKNL